jgi:hypothetical protein
MTCSVVLEPGIHGLGNDPGQGRDGRAGKKKLSDRQTNGLMDGKLIFTRPSLRLVRVSKSHCLLSVTQ